MPADRATLTLAQCCLIVGDSVQAEALIRKAPQRASRRIPAALRLAAGVYFGQNRLDKVEKYLDRLDQAPGATPADKAWANRTRTALLLDTGRPADRDQALALVDQNLANNPDSIEDQLLKATILAVRPGRRGEAVAILEQLAGANRLDDGQRFLLAQLYLGQRNERSTETRCSSS